MDISHCDKWHQKLLGLMFTFRDDWALVFSFNRERYVPLHMFFVFHSIDVVYLNADKKIVETKESLNPFMIYFPKNKAKYVIELPEGSIKENNIMTGRVFSIPGVRLH